MKRLLFGTFLLFLFLPQSGLTQRLSVYNLGVHAGVEYPKLYWNYHEESNPYNGTRDDFTIRPHAQITYDLSLTEHFKPRIFTGYSRLGFREAFAIDDVLGDKGRQHVRMNTISVGIKALFDTSVLKFGPVFSWYKILDAEWEYQIKQSTGQWNTSFVDENYDRFLADHAYEAGFSIQRFIGPNFVVSFEGLYTLNDIFIHEDKLPGGLLSQYTWFPQHYRLTLGYAL